MLKINKGEPWLMWPNSLVENFIDFPANQIFEHSGDFSIKIDFTLDEKITDKAALFCKLPLYCGIDLEEHGLLLILTYPQGKPDYIFGSFTWETDVRYVFELKKTKNRMDITINGETIISTLVRDLSKKDDLSHIIFGAGNFPSNGFNLNYASLTLYYLEIVKDGEVISKHEFEEFIHDKSIDLTDNCNFINKI